MRRLALDTGNTTGWAFGLAGRGPPDCGTWYMPEVKYGMGPMLASYANILYAEIKRLEVEEVCMEEVMPEQLLSAAAAFSHIGVASVTALICFRADVPLKIHHLSKIRSKFIKRVSAPKGQEIKNIVCAEAIKRGCTPDSGDAGDACALWYYADQLPPL